MRRLLNAKATTISFLALVFPLAALANLGPTTINVNSGSTLNLDTGAIGGTGAGDILWNGSSLILQGNAQGFSVISGGTNGSTQFNALIQGGASALSNFPYAPKATLPATGNSVFAVKTNGGNYAAVLVVSVNLGSIQLTYATFGSTGNGNSGPTITQILNNYSTIPAGFPNSGIAQGALFIIKGTGLVNPTATYSSSQDSTQGLPTTLNGSSVKVMVNGSTTIPAFYYANVFSGVQQLALVMPSNTPTGSGTVTVTYSGQTSAPYNINVVSAGMGFAPYALNPATYSPYTYASTIVPGTTITLYGTGLGADPTRDTTYVAASASSTINGLAHIYVGGIDAPIYYQGAFGYPGLNQVDVTIPASVAPGCNVSVVGVNASGIPTNTITLPIGTGAPCTDQAYGILDGRGLASIAASSSARIGVVTIGHGVSANGTVVDEASAFFQIVSGASYGPSGSFGSIGSCVVSQNLTSTITASTSTPMDPGAVSVTGPVGGTQTLSTIPQEPGFYFSTSGQGGTLPTGFVPPTGGQFAVQASGGHSPTANNVNPNVGAFSTTVSFANPLMTWTNQSAAASVSRAFGLPVTWSNAVVGSFVTITGSVAAAGASGSFTCNVSGSSGQFTVPSYILNALPAGSGTVTVSNSTNFNTISAINLDYGYALGLVSYNVNTTFN